VQIAECLLLVLCLGCYAFMLPRTAPAR